jgi:hypothetical protein
MRKLGFVIVLSFSIAACASDARERDASAPESATAAASSPERATAPAPATRTRPAETSVPAPSAPDPGPAYREVTIPAETMLPVELKTPVGSDTSEVEDPVRATLRRPIVVAGIVALPAGTEVLGLVTSAERSARVKGRASVAFRFNQVDLPGQGERFKISTGTISRMAPATKKQDAAKIGGGAAGGAIIGGLLGGGDGAAKGAAIGGAAGTGVVLSTRGKEVRLAPGASLSVRLTAPLTVRVRN